MKFKIIESARKKFFLSEAYNYTFDKVTGVFLRWGAAVEEDPVMAPSPEIMDLEISTVCTGIGKPCGFCYKANVNRGDQMSFETFKDIFDKLPRSITQIAFGIGNLFGHDDMWEIFRYARDNGVIPNVTTNGYMLTDEIADTLAEVMGAVAVSRYDPPDVCYDAVKKLTDRNMDQVNIHMVVSEDSYEQCLQLIEDVKTDERLSKLNAVVFLMMKPKGRAAFIGKGIGSMDKYRELVTHALQSGIKVGFDSCSAPSFLKATEEHKLSERFQMMADPCESGLFSIYADVEGKVYPCSFTPGTPGWEDGIPLQEVDSFDDVWNHDRMLKWKDRLLSSTKDCGGCKFQDSCRSCPLYKIDLCK